MSVSLSKRGPWSLDPVLMMFGALAIAVALTWVIPSGSFQRDKKGLVVPGTYTVVPKETSMRAILPHAPAKTSAWPASPASIVSTIPGGMVKSAALIFMITALGGMFGVLRSTGTIEVAIERLVALTRGKVGLLTVILMMAISAGGSFLGLISEYLLIIPVFLALSKRLGLEPMFGFALVTVAAKIGYIASVSNPVILAVAQPIAGVRPFSGTGFRLAIWLVFMAVGILYVLRLAKNRVSAETTVASSVMTSRHVAIVWVMVVAIGILLWGAKSFGWDNLEFAAFYLLLAIILAAVAGLAPRHAVHVVVDGMKSMVLAGLLVGMAKAVENVLNDAQILDTIVYVLAGWASRLHSVMVGMALVLIEMFLGLLIPSGSAKAALSMPILVPIAQMSGVAGQTTVLAFILGNGLINMFAPTSGMLLAYLATADIPYSKWFRFVLPLFLVLTVLSLIAIGIAVLMQGRGAPAK